MLQSKSLQIFRHASVRFRSALRFDKSIYSDFSIVPIKLALKLIFWDFLE